MRIFMHHIIGESSSSKINFVFFHLSLFTIENLINIRMVKNFERIVMQNDSVEKNNRKKRLVGSSVKSAKH